VLAARLAARPGVAVVLTGAPSDRLLVDTALGAARPAFPVDLSGHLDLPSLGALFARCAVVVAPDTGPLHLATAVGAKTVAIFGPSDPLRTGPVGEGHQVVRADLVCVPCRARHCRRVDRPHACMEDLTVEAVEAAVLVALEPSAAVAR
jgi:ADP-heptose:LPS heptosyltransferase